MTTPSTRIIAWDIPAQPDGAVKPDANNFQFAAWLLQEDPATTSELERLSNANDFIKHVGFQMAPSRPVAQRTSPYTKPIAAAYNDTRIQKEFDRWASSFSWENSRTLYMRWIESAFHELSAPWIVHTATQYPIFHFALLLTLALEHDDAQSVLRANPSLLQYQQAIEDALQKMTLLGLPIPTQEGPQTLASPHVFQYISAQTPDQDIRPFVDLFSSFYAPRDTGQPRHSAKGTMHYHDALFRGAIDAYKNTFAISQTLALPEDWLGDSTPCS